MFEVKGVTTEMFEVKVLYDMDKGEGKLNFHRKKKLCPTV